MMPDQPMTNYPFHIFPRRLIAATAWPVVCALLIMGLMHPVCAATVSDLAKRYFPPADRVGEFDGEPLAAFPLGTRRSGRLTRLESDLEVGNKRSVIGEHRFEDT